ncbi:MAG: hypothetical protein H6852_13875 [Geminicoccaceae bacterium]|nr:hypothetical protein [Geminicoccaceae bacterium]HRY23891.1 hypothetical protein [Geminicoccaceae bacterium]
MRQARRYGGRWAGRAALVALLLQLAQPWLGLQPVRAEVGPTGPVLVICTGSGLLRIYADGTPVQETDRQGLHCTACVARLHGPALLPTAPALRLPRVATPVATRVSAPGTAARATAPPLPARGPPTV